MVAGGSFAIAQYLSSNFLGPELPDIISSLASLICLTLFLRRWQPVRIFRFKEPRQRLRPQGHNATRWADCAGCRSCS